MCFGFPFSVLIEPPPYPLKPMVKVRWRGGKGVVLGDLFKDARGRGMGKRGHGGKGVSTHCVRDYFRVKP